MSKQIKITFLLFFAFASIIQAQVTGSLKLGVSGYQGDIHCRTDDAIGVLEALNPSFGIGARIPLAKALGLRAEATYFQLSADETAFDNIGHNNRGWSLDNKFLEIAALLDYEFFHNKRFDENGQFKRGLSPLIFGGVGLAFNDPEVDFKNSTNPNITQDREEADKALLAIPVGLGLKYYISEAFALALETGIRLPISDYYDGVSLSASADQNDAYGFGGLKGYFRLGKASDQDDDGIADKHDLCPEVYGLESFSGCPDSDMDGIIDEEDKCPRLAGSADKGGCPDADNDGIIDPNDDCPNDAGDARLGGCPDTDGDGIINSKDLCPNIAGLKNMEGCPDTDGDGITDAKDDCPNEAGLNTNNGCPLLDADNDGIVDAEDDCPNMSGGSSTNGCPDRDNDGVADQDDNCPDLAANTTSGCPRVTTPSNSSTSGSISSGSTSTSPSTTTGTTRGTVSTANSYNDINRRLARATENLKFPSASSNLTPTATAALDDVVAVMRENPSFRLNINGYTDSQGNDAANQQLSARRARASYDYLVSKGIDPSRLNHKGFGETNPIASNGTSEGRRKNRRVEFILFDSTGRLITKAASSYYSNSSSDCNCGNGQHPLFNIPKSAPKSLSRLGTNPEFGNSHDLNTYQFFEKLQNAYITNKRDQIFLNKIFRGMGYTGFEQATASLFTAVELPYGSVGNIGYSAEHKTLYAKLNVSSNRDLKAFHIRSANGCDVHFMKTCGNHFFFCN